MQKELSKKEMKRISALIRALYATQSILEWPNASFPHYLHFHLCGMEHGSWINLRKLESLTDDEKESISKHMQVYPDDLIDWINGDSTHEDFNAMWTWLPCIDYLRQIGIALPFYDVATKTTLNVEQQVEYGIIKLL